MDSDDIRDLFAAFGPVGVRRMFGGAGVFTDGLMIALVSDGVLHLKADEQTIPAFEREGQGPFTYATKHGRRSLTSFWRMPDRLYDEPDELARWAHDALGVARRGAARARSSVSRGGRAKARRPARYDARGNVYVVATPDEVGFPAAQLAYSAARTSGQWTRAAVDRLCSWEQCEERSRCDGEKEYASDGLLVGPFGERPPYELLIVNTDGSLAERSGNGLTIFAQFLVDRDYVKADEVFDLVARSSSKPVKASIEPARRGRQNGFWVDMGKPRFGPKAVGAVPSGLTPRAEVGGQAWTVHCLQDIDRGWDRSVLVKLGNPHCVTFVASARNLPASESLGEGRLRTPLTAIAYAPADGADRERGRSFQRGINLQWAHVPNATAAGGEGRVIARVFERGAGPTRSSGSSATAVACAAWHLGLLRNHSILVEMPGGDAPIELDVDPAGGISRARLFGVAKQL